MLDLLLRRSGLTQAELARRLGVRPQTIRQYRLGKRRNSLQWFMRFAHLCGARVIVEFPAR